MKTKPKRLSKSVDQIVYLVERFAAIVLVAMMLNVFIGVVLRYVWTTAIPDAFDLGKFLLGILIFWGIAAANYTRSHISVDLLWEVSTVRGRLLIELFASIVSLLSFSVLAYMVGRQLLNVYQSNVLTYDLRLPIWPAIFLMWLGLIASVILLIPSLINYARRLFEMSNNSNK